MSLNCAIHLPTYFPMALRCRAEKLFCWNIDVDWPSVTTFQIDEKYFEFDIKVFSVGSVHQRTNEMSISGIHDANFSPQAKEQEEDDCCWHNQS